MLIEQIPRSALLWMLFGLSWAVLPHSQYLPMWILGSALLVLLWRYQIYRGRWAMPGSVSKAALVLVCAFGIWRGYGNWRGLEPMTGLLVMGLILKMLEMKNRRDALLTVYLGVFLSAVQLLFSQQIWAAAYALLSLWWLLTAQHLLHAGTGFPPVRALKHAGAILAQAVPLMLVLFLAMPRLSPLWAMPSQHHAARTGVSDSMSPGDVANLTRSGRLAFRADFQGPIPPHHERYWRGLVMSDFDGRSWRQRDRFLMQPNWRDDEPAPWRAGLDDGPPGEQRWHYQLLMEPSFQPWLFTLGTPLQVSGKPLWGVTRDQTLQSRRPLTERHRFELVSGDRPMASALSALERQHYLRLPAAFNPRTRALAQQWALEVRTPGEFTARFRDWVNRSFIYTLQPPALGEHSVDEFLFVTRQGFCEHFASSYVVAARAAGIPARVVTGYQGGEQGLEGNYLMVYQLDAHAWAEIWHDGHWLRVDPTAFVAPERIRNGLRAALPDNAGELGEALSLMRYSNIDWMNRLRLQWEQLDYEWQSRVLNFEQEDQQGLLRDWFGAQDPLTFGLIFLALAGSPLALIALWQWWRDRPAPVPRHIRLLQQLERRFKLNRLSGEAPSKYFERLAVARPALRARLRQLSSLYDRCVYGPASQQQAALKALREQMVGLRE